MIDPLQQKEDYLQQLDQWFSSALIKVDSRKDFLKLTAYFSFDEVEKEMSASTLSRTAGNSADLPTRKEGKYNLYTVLGVLFMLQIIDRNTIEVFLQTYGITPPKADEWAEIWNKIETGAREGRQNLERVRGTAQDRDTAQIPAPLPTIPNTRFVFNRPLLFGVLLLVSVTLIGIILLANSAAPHASSSDPCSQLVAQTDPTFLPDQGFSQFFPATDNPESSILSNNIRSIGIGTTELWIGYIPDAKRIASVSQYTGKTWKHCEGFPLVAGQNVNDIAFQDNSVFLATDGAGIGQLTTSGWRIYTKQDGLPSDSIYDLLIDSNNQIWAATDEGVARFINEGWDIAYQVSPDTLASNHVHEIFIDDAGNFWFGFRDRGISRLATDSTWQSFYTNYPGVQNIRGITSDIPGGIWIATEGGGILRFFNDEWTRFTEAEYEILSDSIQDIEQDKYGRIWAATDKGVIYTADNGHTWQTHSTMATLDIAFGCPTCSYNEDHIWLALKDQGLGHVRIPPNTQTVRFTSLPQQVQLKPGEKYVFEVEVQVISEHFTTDDGDSLRAIEPLGSSLYGAYPIIPVLGDEVKPGQTYTFSNTENPIIAPDEIGIYQTHWRIWQGRRFTSGPIIIEFEVVP